MQQIVRSIILVFSAVPRYFRIMLVFLAVFSTAILVWKSSLHYHNSTFSFKSIEFNKKKIYSLPLIVGRKRINQSIQTNKTIYKDNLSRIITKELNVCDHILSIDDKIDEILNKNKINTNDISQISAIEKRIQNLKISQQFSWILTANRNLQHLTWEILRCKIRTYNRIYDNLKVRSELYQDGWIDCIMKETLDNKNNNVGFTRNTMITVLKGIQWKIDFRKIKKGDKFSVLVQRNLLDDKSEKGYLIGVHLRSDGKDYYAIRAQNGKFYDHNGTSLAKSFLRFPTTKTFRISSNFNLRRLHPVTGRVSPHRGVDFAMPQGTPVLAVGDGEVVTAKHNNAAGFYIAVRHNNIYTTRYMHLRKLLVKQGQKVKRGELIALSGNTGNSTGPHLHYEVWINKKAVNPITVEFPRNERLTGKERHKYLIQVKDIISQLRFDSDS